MFAQIRCRRVLFRHSFVLPTVNEVQPAGTYSVETRNAGGGLFSASVATSSTWIRICESPGLGGSLNFVDVDASDLENAMALDRATELSSLVRRGGL
jgi:hypothetical protein